MPEASVDEYRKISTSEDDVGPSPVPQRCEVDSVPVSSAVQQPPDGEFRLGVPTSVGLHRPTDAS